MPAMTVKRRWLLGLALLGLVLLVCAAHSNAHRGHAVWTDIHWAEDRFSLARAEDEERAVFETIGAEIVDGFVYVYQEWSTPLPAEFSDIDNRVLLDVDPGSQAFIRIKGPGLDEERVR